MFVNINTYRRIVLLEKNNRYEYEKLDLYRYMIAQCLVNHDSIGFKRYKGMFKSRMRVMSAKNLKNILKTNIIR